ncbi:MAG: hypothetical protein R2729_05425 [Bryobacteraceae bacterium]
MQVRFDFDAALKEIFERDRPSLVGVLSGGQAIRAFVNVELPVVESRTADIVAPMADGSIFHIEFQSTNDRDIRHRQGIYYHLLAQRHRCAVEQVVLYVGRAKERMPKSVLVGKVRVPFRIVDFRTIPSEALLATGRPADTGMALLAGGGEGKASLLARQIERRLGPKSAQR